MRSNERVFNIALTGLFAALVFVLTAYFPRIPIAKGYIHIGDAAIYLAASLLPQPFAATAAAMGGFLADAATGYMIWAPYTLVIKPCLTLAFTAKHGTIFTGRNFAATLAAFPITVGGYYIAGLMIMGNAVSPLAEIPGNVAQAAGSMALYVLFALSMDRSGVKTRLAGSA